MIPIGSDSSLTYFRWMNESIMVQKSRHKHCVISKHDRSWLDVFRDTTDAQVKEASINGETSSGDIELCVS